MNNIKIKKPSYSTKPGKGKFVAGIQCPNCGQENVYFDVVNGWYECPDCEWHCEKS